MDAIDITLSHIRPDRQLHYENYQVVSAVQALCGGITQNMVAVSLRCLGEEVHLYFYLERESPRDREEIEDSVADLEALQFTNVPVIAHIQVVNGPVRSSEIEGRAIIVAMNLALMANNPVNRTAETPPLVVLNRFCAASGYFHR